MYTPVSTEAQKQLAAIIADSPEWVDFNDTVWEVKQLKYGTLFMVAAEMSKIIPENNEPLELIKHMGNNGHITIRCIALILLNDLKRINNELEATIHTLTWEANPENLTKLLSTVLEKMPLFFYQQNIAYLEMLQKITLERKLTKEEADTYQQEQS